MMIGLIVFASWLVTPSVLLLAMGGSFAIPLAIITVVAMIIPFIPPLSPDQVIALQQMGECPIGLEPRVPSAINPDTGNSWIYFNTTRAALVFGIAFASAMLAAGSLWCAGKLATHPRYTHLAGRALGIKRLKPPES